MKHDSQPKNSSAECATARDKQFELRVNEEQSRLITSMQQVSLRSEMTPELAQELKELANDLKALESNPDTYFSAKDAIQFYENAETDDEIFALGSYGQELLFSCMVESSRGVELLLKHMRIELECGMPEQEHLQAIIAAVGDKPEAQEELRKTLDQTVLHPKLRAKIVDCLAARPDCTELFLKYAKYNYSVYPDLVSSAIQALAGRTEAQSALLEFLDNQNDDIRRAAAEALSGEAFAQTKLISKLGNIKDKAAHAYIEALDSSDRSTDFLLELLNTPGLSHPILQSISDKLKGNERAHTALLDILESSYEEKGKNQDAKNRVLYAIFSLKGSSPAKDQLLKHFFEESGPLRSAAAYALRAIPEAAKEIQPYLTQEDPGKRAAAATALAGNADYEDELRKLLRDQDEVVRSYAIEAAAGIDGLVSELLLMTYREEDRQLIEEIVQALAGKPEAAPRLIELFQNKETAEEIAWHLAKSVHGRSEAFDVLFEHILDETQPYRGSALDALKAIPRVGCLIKEWMNES